MYMHAFFLFQLFWIHKHFIELKLLKVNSKPYFSTSWHFKSKWMVRPCWIYLYMLIPKNRPHIYAEARHYHTDTKPSHGIHPSSENREFIYRLLHLQIDCQAAPFCIFLLHVKSVSRIGGILISPAPICNSSILLMKMLSTFHRLHARALLPLR